MRLEQEIVEIHTVFMDLATIVNQKWEELNRIEDHLNGAFDNGLFICYVIQKSAMGIPLPDQPPQSVLRRWGLVH